MKLSEIILLLVTLPFFAMKNETAAYIFSSVGIVLGSACLFSPLLLYWWIHGSYERYLWIINSPAPLGNLGSGPYQWVLYATGIGVGLLLVICGLLLRRAVKRF